MRKAKWLLFALALGLLSVGCAKLNYEEIAPNAAAFKPRAVVILPVKMPEGMDLESETASNVITDALNKINHFGRVIDPATVRAQMAANKALQDTIINYLAKLRMLGVSEKELSKKIGAAYHADTLIIVDIGRWGTMRWGGKGYAEVSFSIKMVDSATGTIIWKAGHADQRDYLLFKPNIADMGRDLALYIFEHNPTRPQK